MDPVQKVYNFSLEKESDDILDSNFICTVANATSDPRDHTWVTLYVPDLLCWGFLF